MFESANFDRLNDADLVNFCNNGSRAQATGAFNTLYKRHKSFVIRVAQLYSGDNNLALDALQETFAFLLSKFPPTGNGLVLTAKLTTYLYPIAKNCAITQRRKAGRATDSAADPDTLAGAPVAGDGDVPALLAELPAERREVVELRFVYDFSLQDIAATLNIPLGTVKSRLHSAIEQLRNSSRIKRFFEK